MHTEDYIQSILILKGIPTKFLDTNMTEFSNTILNSQDSHYVYGATGTGKTRLLCAMARELVSYYEKTPSFQFISVPELMLKIKNTYHVISEHNESEIVDLYSNTDILFLDDLGSEKITDWSRQILYIIINRRYENEKWTTITSNIPLSELSEFIGNRISSRIGGMCSIEKMTGKDRRMTK